jgi:Dolichyl-phosphate-mannose-protein mannosyltransferase
MTLAGVLAVHLVPLALGVLSRGTVLLAAVALLVTTHRVVRRDDAPARMGHAAPRQTAFGLIPATLSQTLAGAGALITLAWWFAYVQSRATLPVSSVDTLSFHLPGVARFIQSGTLWQMTQYVPGQAQGAYPQYGDLLLLSVVLPWHSIAFIRYVDPVLLGVTALSVYAIGRELRAPAPTALLAASLLVAMRPATGSGTVDVLTDPAFLAGFASGTLFLLRYWRTARRSELVLAGVGLGTALGSKWYGLTAVPALLAAWVVVALLVRRAPRWVLRDAAVLIGLIVISGAVWMLRNLILTGNPVFDFRVSVFGATVFPAPTSTIRSSVGFSLAHYLGDGAVLRRYVWPVFRWEFGFGGGLIAVATGLAAVFWLRDRLRPRSATPDPRVLIAALGAIACAAAYVLTPYTAGGFAGTPVLLGPNARYAVPAFLLGAPLLAWVAARMGKARALVELAALGAIVLALRDYLPVSASHLAAAAVAVAVVAAALRLGSISTRRSGIALATGAALACAVGAFAYHYQRVLATRQYSPDDPTVAYVLVHDPSRARIALAGEWTPDGLIPVAPIFGPRLENQLVYVGPVIDHRLEQYGSAGPFEAALRRGRYRLLIVGAGAPPVTDPLPERWARAAGYVPVTQSARLVLLRAP